MKRCASNSQALAGNDGALGAAFACVSCGLRRFFIHAKGFPARASLSAAFCVKGGFFMSMIHIQDLCFAYEGAPQSVFDGLSLELDDSWNLALTGRNGRGKTTLLKLLCGELDAGGSIHARAQFARFPFAVADASLPTGAAMAAVCDAEDWRIEREAGLIGLRESALAQPFDTLSGGERAKALLAALFLSEGCVPLIDEPTNHLDAAGRRVLGRYLARKHGFILASHDRDLLDACCDHVLALEAGGAVLLRGGFSDYLREYERHQALERAEDARLRGEIRRLDEAARRAGEWAGQAEKAKHRTSDSDGRPERGYQGHKAAKLVKRAKGIERRREQAVEQKSTLLRHVEEAGEVRLRPLEYHSERLCGLENATVCLGTRAVLDGASLEVRRGERIALLGGNGCGKTTALRALLGEIVPEAGRAWRGGGLRISYVPQDASFLRGWLRDLAGEHGVDVTQFFTILRKLGFSRERLEADADGLSDGQKKKVLLALSLCESAHLYIWDEPLNYIDALSRVQIEELILRCQPTLVFVEHDAAFVRRVATRCVRLDEAAEE